MIYLTLFLSFFKIGLFTIGGGLASLPLFHDEMVDGGYVTHKEFIDMLAISQSTPGPIGINLATYTGYKVASFAGSIVATLGMVAPSLIVIILIAKFITDFNKNYYVRNVFWGLRSATVGLIGTAGWYVFANSVIDINEYGKSSWYDLPSILLFVSLCVAYIIFKKLHPAYYIIVGAVAGLIIF